MREVLLTIDYLLYYILIFLSAFIFIMKNYAFHETKKVQLCIIYEMVSLDIFKKELVTEKFILVTP